MTAWLHDHGFSYKKPAVVPGKANKISQEQWLKAYKELKANLPQDEAICCIDGVHPTHNMKSTYGWIRKGERKELHTNTGRQRLNLSGAIDIISKKETHSLSIRQNRFCSHMLRSFSMLVSISGKWCSRRASHECSASSQGRIFSGS